MNEATTGFVKHLYRFIQEELQMHGTWMKESIES